MTMTVISYQLSLNCTWKKERLLKQEIILSHANSQTRKRKF